MITSPDAGADMLVSFSSASVSSVKICVSTYALMLCWVARALGSSSLSVSVSRMVSTVTPFPPISIVPESVALARVEVPVAVRVPAAFTPTEEICKAETSSPTDWTACGELVSVLAVFSSSSLVPTRLLTSIRLVTSASLSKMTKLSSSAAVVSSVS